MRFGFVDGRPEERRRGPDRAAGGGNVLDEHAHAVVRFGADVDIDRDDHVRELKRELRRVAVVGLHVEDRGDLDRRECSSLSSPRSSPTIAFALRVDGRPRRSGFRCGHAYVDALTTSDDLVLRTLRDGLRIADEPRRLIDDHILELAFDTIATTRDGGPPTEAETRRIWPYALFNKNEFVI